MFHEKSKSAVEIQSRKEYTDAYTWLSIYVMFKYLKTKFNASQRLNIAPIPKMSSWSRMRFSKLCHHFSNEFHFEVELFHNVLLIIWFTTFKAVGL